MGKTRRKGFDNVKFAKSNDSSAEVAKFYGDQREEKQPKEISNNYEWAPATSTVFNLLFSIRLLASWWSLIMDCDEVYNYWEPLHLLLFGWGFQTWEYSPIYAIRSWLYISLYALPAPILLPLFHYSKVALFFSLRFYIGFMALISELFLFRTICSRLGNSIGRSYIVFSLFSTAMFNASSAFLPSSFSMVFNAFSIAFYLREQYFAAILFVAISALIGWPFAALLGLPLVIQMFILHPKQLALKFIIYSFICGSFILGCLYSVDSQFFGLPVIAPLNIIIYNIFSSNGPNLYGIEPASFYFLNLFLNFNLAFPLAIFSFPFAYILFHLKSNDEKRRKDGKRPNFEWIKEGHFHNNPFLLIYLTASIWFITFLLQPHKEERFMFPIYPHICLLAALFIDCLSRCTPHRCRQLPTFMAMSILSVFILLSFSRTFALHRNFSGVIEVYKEFNEKMATGQFQRNITENNTIRICVGKEWHRFPSSFFLPEFNSNNPEMAHGRVELFFVRSEFRGLLPGKFAEGNGSSILNITKIVPKYQNDQNREEPSHYADIELCHFLVDFEGPSPTKLEPEYSKMVMNGKAKFKSVIQRPMLISAQSHPLLRAFFIPFTPNDYLKFGTVHIFQRTFDKN